MKTLNLKKAKKVVTAIMLSCTTLAFATTAVSAYRTYDYGEINVNFRMNFKYTFKHKQIVMDIVLGPIIK